MLKRFFLPGQRHCPHPSRALFFLVALFSEAVDASDLIPADCNTALNDQQLALGKMFAGERGDQETSFSSLSRHANNVSRITSSRSLAAARAPRPRR